jgi:uncharacterized membrane protein
MNAGLRKLLTVLGDTFWLLPGALVTLGALGGLAMVAVDRSGVVPQWLIDSPWIYSGGASGARTLLGTVASSTIGVAGTVFSITIAALSLAAGQMGPRLLRNFTRDRRNQLTLGAFLGTFSYALIVLRSIRTPNEGEFIPHLALSIGILLALVCVATLVFFVGHMAGRINVDTVVDLVSGEVQNAVKRLMITEAQPAPPPPAFWLGAACVSDERRGYLQHLDEEGLANWAAEHGTAIRLLVRPGDYVFPGAPIAVLTYPVEGAGAAIRDATALGGQRVSSSDLEFAIRQLVEVAVRALSPGINDPHTAMSVLDRLGATLCDAVTLHLTTGVILRDGRPVLMRPSVDYAGLTDSMFHMIRQNASRSPAVLIRALEVLTAVAGYERNDARLAALQRHADLVLGDAERNTSTPADLGDIRERHRRFVLVRECGPLGHVAASAAFSSDQNVAV